MRSKLAIASFIIGISPIILFISRILRIPISFDFLLLLLFNPVIRFIGIGLFISGIVFGWMAIREIKKDSKLAGKKYAIAGMAINTLLLILFISLAISNSTWTW